MSTPSEVADKRASAGEIDVPELGGTVSWADLERDASCWLGNTMQWAYYTSLRRLEPLVKETEDDRFLRIWRCFQTSDHLYYMFTAGGGPGEVHSYFSPYGTPADAFVTSQAAIFDFESRVRLASIVADEPFLFYTGIGERYFTGKAVWTLKGLVRTMEKISLKSIEFHNKRGDIEKWVEDSLHDKVLAEELFKVRSGNVEGDQLKRTLVRLLKKRLELLETKIESVARYL
jgi:alpha-amylase